MGEKLGILIIFNDCKFAEELKEMLVVNNNNNCELILENNLKEKKDFADFDLIFVESKNSVAISRQIKKTASDASVCIVINNYFARKAMIDMGILCIPFSNRVIGELVNVMNSLKKSPQKNSSDFFINNFLWT